MSARWLIPAMVLCMAGCKGLKESQVGGYIGDKQTKLFYKNTTEMHNKVPMDRQVPFRSFDEASQAGYTAAEAGERTTSDGE